MIVTKKTRELYNRTILAFRNDNIKEKKMYNQTEYAHVMEMIYREIDDDLREEGRIKGLEEGYIMGYDASLKLNKPVEDNRFLEGLYLGIFLSGFVVAIILAYNNIGA